MKNIQFTLPVPILRENNSFIAYSPALDLSTVGATFEEAKKHVEEAVQIFFEEITSKNTLHEVLMDLGWQEQNDSYSPPIEVSHMTQTFSVSIAK